MFARKTKDAVYEVVPSDKPDQHLVQRVADGVVMARQPTKNLAQEQCDALNERAAR